MLDLNARLCPNRADVAAKIMDGEAILINLSDGMYYSMDLAGGLVWELIEAEHSLGEIATTICAHYEVERTAAESDVRQLAEELLRAKLAALSSAESPASQNEAWQPPGQRRAYQPPRLNAYRDMAELLALDPPHPLLTDTLSKYSPES